MNGNINSRIYALCLFIILYTSCNQNREIKTGKEERIKIGRYEQALFSINQERLKEELKKLEKEYRFFLGENANDQYKLNQIRDYITDPVIRQVYEDTRKKYADLTFAEKTLSEAFDRYKKIYPNASIPKVYTYISGIDIIPAVYFADSILIIPIDMYMGSDYELYHKIGIPEYVRARMSEEYIARDCIIQIGIRRAITNESKSPNLLEIMIKKGKTLYFSKALLPELTEEINMGYTKEQTRWCKTNEGNVWAFLISNKLLFSTDNGVIIKFTGDGPFTSVISQEAPPRLGEWLGWQIVEAYMRNNKNITLPELMADKDSQQILNQSLYKPTK